MIPINPSKQEWFRHQLRTWGKKHGRDFPWRRTQDPYALLIAECLLQQTEATQVVPVYKQFLAHYPTVKDLALASLADLSELLHPLGFHFRAARLSQLAQQILRDYGGKIPDAASNSSLWATVSNCNRPHTASLRRS